MVTGFHVEWLGEDPLLLQTDERTAKHGQLYDGQILKGLLLLSGAFCLAELDYRNGGALPTIGLVGLYATSLADVIHTLCQQNK